MVQVAVLGHGVVGSGVVELLNKNSASIAKKAGKEIKLKRILDIREFPDSPYAGLFTKEFADILGDGEISVVAEVMGGVHPAYEFVKACLEAGKSVVTSNKELVAQKGAELLAVAREKDVNFLFEASVGGGIPIIRPIHQCLAANEIDEIAGILNGTTNFILTKMIKEGMAFDEALKMAQELGYAEANPSADVDGHDACRKICILASLAFGSHVYPENVPTRGITTLTAEDVQYADNAGCVIKLIGRAFKTEDGKVYAMVSPALIPKSSQLAGIDDVFNGILVRGDATGDVVFYGKGAGKLPTASAVVGDMVDCVKARGTIRSLQWEDSAENNVADYKTVSTTQYLCFQGENCEALCRDAFGTIQSLARKRRPADEFAFITSEMPEGKLEEITGKLQAKGLTLLSAIRKLDY
ncbi:homoserine dehydrogenase [Ruminococcaceae bacterium OttesenSCG-928-L11]|nr:homoserine dehydrogenase [Ruminococcaceae bacterium OttesenSCG-928-L11]